MSQLRGIPQAKINFIFFQDIITSVMGILILVTLMLSLSLNSGGPGAEEPMERELRESSQQLEELERANRAAQQRSLTLESLPDRAALETEVKRMRIEKQNLDEAVSRSERAVQATRSEAAGAMAAREAAAQLKERVEALRAELAAARRNTNVVYMTAADTGQAERKPVALVVSGDKVQLRRFDGAGGSEQRLESAEVIRPLLAGLDRAKEYVILYFRPSGVKWFLPLRELTRGAGFEMGYDAVEEQQELIFGGP